MIFTALWHTLQDFAHGLGWIGLGILVWFAMNAAFGGVYTWIGTHRGSCPTVKRELQKLEANPDYTEALKCKGRLPRQSDYEKAGRSA